LATIGRTLTPDGDILLYGCDVARGEVGRTFIADLARLTGADVAAALHMVGSAELGGTWDLDAATGAIEAENPFGAAALEDFQGLLATSLTTIGDEFKLNTVLPGSQDFPAVARLSGGGFVAVWVDQNGPDIFARIFNDAGTGLGVEFLVNTTTVGAQTFPTITGLADGGFVIGWSSSQITPINDIYLQRFNSTGGRIGGETPVDTTGAGAEIHVSATATARNDGGYLLTWSYSPSAGANTATSFDVYGRVYDVNGAPLGNDFRINSTATATTQAHSSAATLVDGRTLVVWQSNGGVGDAGYGIYGRFIDTSGNASGTDFRINSEVALNQDAPSVAALTGGGYVVVWRTGDINEVDVNARVFTAAGAGGAEFRVSTSSIGDQFSPSVTALSDGGFAVSWTSIGSHGDVVVRRFDALGGNASTEVLANQATPAFTGESPVYSDSFNNRAPDHTLTQLQDGSLVAVWYGGTSDVYGRKFDLGVTAPNSRPELDSNATPVLTAESEDARAPFGAVGTLVSTLVDINGPLSNVTDADANPATGIAVTAVSIPPGSPVGRWWYSTDNGTNWSQLGPVSDTAARLLAADANTRLYFEPSDEFNGTIVNAITFKAWDQSLGVNGSVLDTTLYNAFSTATDTANLTIDPANDAPTLTLTGASTFTEGAAPVLVLSAATIADAESDTIKSATVTIREFVDGDELRINGSTIGDTGANIHFTFSGNILTLAGEDTYANYADALKLVTLGTTSADPSAGGTRPTAHIDFRVNTETALGPSAPLFTRYLPDVDAVSPVQGFAETPHAILLGDLDGDGRNDLIIADSDATSGFRFNLVVEHGNGDGTFSSPQTYEIGQNQAVGDRPVSMVLGNFDGDAFLDLALTSSVSNQVLVFLGDGSGGFTPSPWPSANPPPGYGTGNKPAALATADFDSDGFADLVVGNVDDSSAISLLKGNGAGGFSQTGSLPVGARTRRCDCRSQWRLQRRYRRRRRPERGRRILWRWHRPVR
jgi:hypothetical protein